MAVAALTAVLVSGALVLALGVCRHRDRPTPEAVGLTRVGGSRNACACTQRIEPERP